MSKSGEILMDVFLKTRLSLFVSSAKNAHASLWERKSRHTWQTPCPSKIWRDIIACNDSTNLRASPNEKRSHSMRLQGKTIGYFVAEEVEDLEFWVPVMRLREEGARVIVIGLTTGTVRGKHGLEMTPDVSIDEAPKADELHGLVIPGGWAPDKLRRNQKVLQLVRDVDAQGKIIGTICHGGWVPISAGIMKGRKAVCSTGIKDDITNAGGIWINQATFREGHMVWGRVVEDIPDFCRELVAAFAE